MTATLDALPSAHEPTDGPSQRSSGAHAAAPRALRPVPAALAPWHDPHPRLAWLSTLIITVLAALTRFWSLGFPPGPNTVPKNGMNFDEVYYAVEAQEILRYGYEDNRGYMFIVHPPLGKLWIALSEKLWDGNSSQYLTNSLGWRIGPAVAGCLGVIMVSRIARRILRSTLFGFVAGLLMVTEGLSLVLARTAILDIFLQLFVIAGFGALLIDRDRMRARLAGLLAEGADLSGGISTLGPRPWRLIGGVCLALACAVKWTGVSFFVGFAVLSLLWDRAALKTAGVRRPTRATLRRSVLPAVGSFGLAPLGAYLLTYLGWFAGENGWNRHWADSHGTSSRLNLPFGIHLPFSWAWVPGPLRALGWNHLDAYRFHQSLDSGHAYGSKPWSWLVLGRPVDFYYSEADRTCGASRCAREVLLIGTPLLWWAFIPALLWLLWHWFTTRDWRAGAVLLAFVAGWLVWFQNLARTMFLFYMAPLVPFLVLGVTLALGALVGPALPAGAVGVATVRRPRVGKVTVGRAPDDVPDVGQRDSDRDSAPAALRRRYWGLGAVCAFLALVVVDFAWMWPLFTGGLRSYAVWHAHMWLPSWV